jgi:pimeloyl-ACP methyl ester carboxylesterase
MLSYEEAGTGPAIVLLHSTVCDRRMWDPQIPALTEAGYRAIRCDFQGYGESPMPRTAYDNAQDVIDLLDALGVAETMVIASSGGGRVALEVAARWPSRVTAMALLCTAKADHEPSAQREAFGDLEEALLEAGDVAGATDLNVRTWVGPEADDATREKVREMQQHAFEVQLAPIDEEPDPIRVEYAFSAITAPTLLISGEHDFPDFQAIAEELAETLPGARHIHLDWAGHLPSMERPDKVNPLLLAFLREPR